MSRIDPNIALNVKTPQPNDALETYGKVLQMRNLLDAGRINKQNIEMNDENIKRAGLANQAAERLQRGQALMDDAVKNNTNVNDDGTITVNHPTVEALLNRNGFSDLAADYNKKRSDIEKNEHERVMNVLDEHAKKVNQLGKMAQTILNAAPDLRPGLYGFALKQAQSGGLLTPEEMKQIPQQYDGEQTEAMLQQMADHAAENPAEAMYKRMQEKRAQQLADVELPGKKAESEQKQLGLESTLLGAATDQASWEKALGQIDEKRRGRYPAQYTPEVGHQAALMGLTPEQRARINDASNLNDLALKAAKGDKDAQKALDILKKREIDIDQAKQLGTLGQLGTPVKGGAVPMSVTAGPEGTDDGVIANLPAGVQSMIKKIAAYDYPLPGAMALRQPYWIKMMELVGQYDKSFDAKEYAARQRLLTSFKSGTDADNIKSINTAIAHLDRLSKSASALGNYKSGDVGPLTSTANAIKSGLRAATGSPMHTIFLNDVNAVSGELTRAFRGTGGALEDVNSWKKTMGESESDDALKAGINEAVELMAGRVKAVKDKYVTGMNKNDKSVLTPTSRDILKKLGIDPNTIEPETAASPAPPAGDLPAGVTEDQVRRVMADPDNKGISRADVIKAIAARKPK